MTVAERRIDSVKYGSYTNKVVCRGSSLVERRPEKAGVASSILAPGTITYYIGNYNYSVTVLVSFLPLH